MMLDFPWWQAQLIPLYIVNFGQRLQRVKADRSCSAIVLLLWPFLFYHGDARIWKVILIHWFQLRQRFALLIIRTGKVRILETQKCIIVSILNINHTIGLSWGLIGDNLLFRLQNGFDILISKVAIDGGCCKRWINFIKNWKLHGLRVKLFLRREKYFFIRWISNSRSICVERSHVLRFIITFHQNIFLWNDFFKRSSFIRKRWFSIITNFEFLIVTLKILNWNFLIFICS